MININLERLENLKEMAELTTYKVPTGVEVYDTKSKVLDYNEAYRRRKKIERIKNYIESRIEGIEVTVSGGQVIEGSEDYLEIEGKKYLNSIDYAPLKIVTRRTGEANTMHQISLSGCIFDSDEYEIYDEYLNHLIRGEKVEPIYISNTEIYLSNMIEEEVYLSECGYMCKDNQLVLFKDEKAYVIISDVVTEVQGIIKVAIPDESIVVVCNDRTILLTDEWFYVDKNKSGVA